MASKSMTQYHSFSILIEYVGLLGFHWWLSGKESTCDIGNKGSIPGLGRSSGEGNGNPLQYSCLENSTDRRVWWATVHGVAKSQTRLSTLHGVTKSQTRLSMHAPKQTGCPMKGSSGRWARRAWTCSWLHTVICSLCPPATCLLPFETGEKSAHFLHLWFQKAWRLPHATLLTATRGWG